MLFNFGENEMSLEINGRVVRTETRLCLREDEVFNIYSHKCVTLMCDGMDMRPVNGTCLLKDRQVMNGTGQLYPHGAHIFTITLSVHLGDESLHCPSGKLSIHQSEFNLVNDSLLYIPSGVMLPPGNFSLTKHGAIICSHFSRSHTDQVVFFDYSNTQVVLTIVASSVSMTSLVGVLLVYSFLPQLRNVPGKIVMSLSATLLVAQGLQLMTKVPTGPMCVAVASLVHTMWLSTFLWMSLLSIDLARSLRSMSPLSGIESHNKLFCLYACVGWGIPFLLVVTCIVIDRFHVWGISIGYGSDHLCWIANPKASLYVFGLPLALTLLINVTCFILTLISIEKTASKVASHSKSCKNEKKRLGIYVRLSFIMGFSWIFCFIAAFAHVPLLWYFQIVLNGLQGFYIFVCFLCKSRNFKLLKEKLYCLPKKTQTRGNTATASTS
ncbi:adhesion G-protein coupled receptor G6-like [Haliotis rubra]|uniref:adhesion G-protein coupled receptor G6-like n=1 Tax=Haliotis rubra TaxID=36100 RepID=UPI001EE59286|nr:adhesion G-protein coupled receptor G6-like [Haliotis rubra]